MSYPEILEQKFDTVGELVALTAQRLRRFAEVWFSGSWVHGQRPCTQLPLNRIHEPRSGESSQ